MKALSVHQPWPELIACGAKTIENRDWRTPYRGPLVIHASKNTINLDNDPRIKAYWKFEAGHFGVIYCLVELADVVPLEEVADRPYAEGPYCWILANPRPIERVAYRGMPGIFNVPDNQIRILPS
jgi:hypothetical protein